MTLDAEIDVKPQININVVQLNTRNHCIIKFCIGDLLHRQLWKLTQLNIEVEK